MKGDYNYHSVPNNIGKDYYYVKSTSDIRMDRMNRNNAHASTTDSSDVSVGDAGFKPIRKESSSSGENVNVRSISSSCGHLVRGSQRGRVDNVRVWPIESAPKRDENSNTTVSKSLGSIPTAEVGVDGGEARTGVTMVTGGKPVNVVHPSTHSANNTSDITGYPEPRKPFSTSDKSGYQEARKQPPTSLNLDCVAASPRTVGSMVTVGTGEGSVTSPLSPCVDIASPPAFRKLPILSIPPPPALDKHETRLKVNRRSASPEKKLRKRRSRSREKSRSQSPEPTVVVPSLPEKLSESKLSQGSQTLKSTTARLARSKPRSSSEGSLDRRRPVKGGDPSPSKINYSSGARNGVDRGGVGRKGEGERCVPKSEHSSDGTDNDRPSSGEFCSECHMYEERMSNGDVTDDVTTNITRDDHGYSGSMPSESQVVCEACNDKCRDIQGAPVVLVPSRESRRVRAKPQMPVIVEDVLRDQEEGSEGEGPDSSTPCSTLRSQVSVGQRSLSSSSSSDHHSPERSVSGSLLDTLHKKYYPNQYKKPVGSPRTRSAETLYTGGQGQSSGKKRYHFQYDAFIKSATVPHAKSGKDTLKVRVSPDRLSDSAVSDSAVGGKLESVPQGSYPPSTLIQGGMGSPTPAPPVCRPPALNRGPGSRQCPCLHRLHPPPPPHRTETPATTGITGTWPAQGPQSAVGTEGTKTW